MGPDKRFDSFGLCFKPNRRFSTHFGPDLVFLDRTGTLVSHDWTWADLGRLWPTLGRGLGRSWTNLGPTLGRRWADCGPTFGYLRGRLLDDVWSTFGRRDSNAGGNAGG